MIHYLLILALTKNAMNHDKFNTISLEFNTQQACTKAENQIKLDKDFKVIQSCNIGEINE